MKRVLSCVEVCIHKENLSGVPIKTRLIPLSRIISKLSDIKVFEDRPNGHLMSHVAINT